MKGYNNYDKNTFRLPWEDMLGMGKALKIMDFLCFLYDLTNDLPIFLESRTCNYKFRTNEP